MSNATTARELLEASRRASTDVPISLIPAARRAAVDLARVALAEIDAATQPELVLEAALALYRAARIGEAAAAPAPVLQMVRGGRR